MFRDLLDTGSQLTLIPQDPKYHHDFLMLVYRPKGPGNKWSSSLLGYDSQWVHWVHRLTQKYNQYGPTQHWQSSYWVPDLQRTPETISTPTPQPKQSITDIIATLAEWIKLWGKEFESFLIFFWQVRLFYFVRKALIGHQLLFLFLSHDPSALQLAATVRFCQFLFSMVCGYVYVYIYVCSYVFIDIFMGTRRMLSTDRIVSRMSFKNM